LKVNILIKAILLLALCFKASGQKSVKAFKDSSFHSETKSVAYSEAVEEALCFGWIDSLTNKRDAESRYQRFSPRKPIRSHLKNIRI